MSRWALGALVLAFAAGVTNGQSLDELNLQIHGFATQSFLYSNVNNYLGMNTSSGTAGWTEAALNLNSQPSDNLRIGIQFHYTRLGIFGGDGITVDWALGDYKLRDWLGMRAGKVKMRWGLYNDTQDYDPGYMWSLLPENIYGIDYRSTDLAQMGVEFYGRVPLKKRLGKIEYSIWYGDYFYAADEGPMESFREQGLNFISPPGGKTPGFDLRWATPISGLNIGGSLMAYDASGTLTNGTYRQPLAYWPTGYLQYEFKKFFCSGQYAKLVQWQNVSLQGQASVSSVIDERDWFLMGGYHLTKKLQAGAYYAHDFFAGTDQSNPANYFHESVASGRYDITPNFYAKLETHFIGGYSLGFYNVDNPNGLQKRTNLVVGKIGFVF
jgi:hypothetical protein